ncbi:ABC transporter ATP-binding protein [Aerococcus tenax]|uniref:ABC transporter ATP-binding protein n=1 Tax=Aerococcus tenax TaxID=3078812 RepID=UPI0018A6FE4D|nr:ABC transporter ATP-binding protein [Aerococcus tenax]
MTLSVEHLSGGYSNYTVLHDLNFSVQAGEIVGLIGLNGAGKSTTIKHILGLLKPSAGEILVNGHSLAKDNQAYRQALSYIPEQPILYPELTLREHIQVIALAYHIDPDQAMANAEPLLERFRLTERLDWLPIHFSKGMKQKVMIVCAMLVDTMLYIIDEPFVGLDPLGIDDFTQLLLKKRQAGAAILMSTHILSSAEHYCDRFIFLHEGQIKAKGTLLEIRQRFNKADASLDELYVDLVRGQSHDL